MSDYNGWTNYETWVVQLWLSNDNVGYDYWVERAQSALDDAEGDTDDAANALASELSDYHDELQPEVTGVFADLINASLGRVDWREIADHWVADAEYTSDDPEPDDEPEVARCGCSDCSQSYIDTGDTGCLRHWCPQCDTTNPEGSTVCVTCGGPTRNWADTTEYVDDEPEACHCPQCDFANDSEALRCLACGGGLVTVTEGMAILARVAE